ncbi:MAG: hypothetical protein ACYDH3_13445, partial [Candidatus Aminicenantales bacterium]
MVYVAAAPPETLSNDLLTRAALLIGKEIFDTRLLLCGEIPKILASCRDIDAADSIVRGLKDAGLKAFVCENSELRKNPASFTAHSARLGEKEVIFTDRRGEEVRIESGDAFLIIRGKRQSLTQEKTSTTKMKLNVPATLLTGGIPIMRRVTHN